MDYAYTEEDPRVVLRPTARYEYSRPATYSVEATSDSLGMEIILADAFLAPDENHQLADHYSRVKSIESATNTINRLTQHSILVIRPPEREVSVQLADGMSIYHAMLRDSKYMECE